MRWICAVAVVGSVSASLALAAFAAPPRPDGLAHRAHGATPIDILIESPLPGEVVRNTVHQAPVRGTAVTDGDKGPSAFDVMLVIDVSASTRWPSGVDVDGDGEVGVDPHFELLPPGTYPDDVVCTDPEDTILHAAIAAARKLIETIDPARVRIGVISFSGDVDPETGRRLDPGQQDARLEVPLTHDLERVRVSLADLLARGSHGGTNFAAGVKLAIMELAGLSGAQSEPQSDAKRVILFLTDGTPTLPFGTSVREDDGDTEAALNWARVAHQAGITIHTYALGRKALTSPLAVTEMARITFGNYNPVRNPGEIVSFLQGVSFANVSDVVIKNLTTREVSFDVTLSPDGSFSGFVPVREGKNRLQITMLANDGSESSVEFDIDFEKSGFTERELAIELERIRRRNRELMLLIERERIHKFREQQRKVLEIRPERELADGL